MEKRICKQCGKEFVVYKSQMNKCCSRSCGAKYRFKTQGHPRHLLKLKGVKIKHPWGKGHSDKTKEKISETKRKQIKRHKIVKCDNCGKNVYKMFGNLWDYRYKRKMKHHFCSRKCSTEYFIGKLHPAWKRGHEVRYGIGKRKWVELSNEIKIRDNFICQICKEKKDDLLVHHITPFSISKDNGLKNLITLCRNCHMQLHKSSKEVIKLNHCEGNENKEKLGRIRNECKRKSKEKARRLKKENPKANRGRVLAQNHIKIPEGKLCEICNKNLATDRHHKDYDKPLDVILVCRKCHYAMRDVKK